MSYSNDIAQYLTAKMNLIIDGLNSKSDQGHGHEIADVQDLGQTLAGKSGTRHGHTMSEITGRRHARVYVGSANGGQDCMSGAYVKFPDLAYQDGVTLYNSDGFQINNEGVYLISFNVSLITQLNNRSVYRARLFRNQGHLDGTGGRTYMRHYSYGNSGTISYTGVHFLESGVLRVFVDRVSGGAAPTHTVGGECSFSITRVG